MIAGHESKFCGSAVIESTDIPLRVAMEAIPFIKAQAQFKEFDTVALIAQAKERCMGRLVVSDRLTAIAILIAVKQHKTVKV